MHALGETMKIKAALVMAGRASARVGLVSATRQDLFAVKVQIQPEGVETGWLPVLAAMAGNGWGICARPIQGSQVLVLFQEDDPSNGVVIGSLFSVPDQPPSTTMKDGEFWLVHQSGSLLQFTADGKVTVTSHGDLNLNAGGNINLAPSGGNVNVTGTLKASVDVQGGSEPVSLINHKHTLVQPGSGVSGPPQ